MSGSKIDLLETKRVNETVKAIELVKTLYYGYGRNSWYSTWSAFYCPSYIYSDFKDVRDKVEEERKQGSVFNINEIAGLLITTNNSKYILIDYCRTQSECDNEIFKNLALKITNDVDFFKHETKLSMIVSYVSCSTMRYAFYSIEPDSNFQLLNDFIFRKYTSHSVGVDYYLSYNSVNIDYDCTSAKKIVELYKERVSIKNNFKKDTIDINVSPSK